MLKNTKRSKFFCIAVMAGLTLLAASCGGGDSGSSATGQNTGPINTTISSSSLSAQQMQLSSFQSLAFSSTNTGQLVFLDKVLKFFRFNAYAQVIGVPEFVGIPEVAAPNSVIAPENLFSKTLNITNFAAPTVTRTGNFLLAFSGSFPALLDSNGNSVDCSVLVAEYADGSSPTIRCLWVRDVSDLNTFPTAVIRDGNIGGYKDSSDSVYFVVNRQSGGFRVFKFSGQELILAKSSETGKVTKLISGDKALFGYDHTATGSATSIFGSYNKESSPGLGLEIADIESSSNAIPVAGKYVFRVNVPNPSNDGSFVAFYDLENSTITSFANEFSPNCDSPESLENVNQHNYGSIWLSSSDLCEAYQVVSNPVRGEKAALRKIDGGVAYSQVKTNATHLIALKSTGELVIDALGPNQALDGNNGATLTQARVIDTTDDRVLVDLDTVTDISVYSRGFIIRGTKNGVTATRFFNSSTNDLDSTQAGTVLTGLRLLP